MKNDFAVLKFSRNFVEHNRTTIETLDRRPAIC